MSGLKKWGLLYEYFEKSQRPAIVRSLYKKPFGQSWRYWLAFVIYLMVSVLSEAYIFYVDDPQLYVSTLPIGVTAFSIYVWLEFQIEKEFGWHYRVYNLQRFPFFRRTKYLSYLLFTEKLNQTHELARGDVASLIKWESIRQQKLVTFDFSKNPITLLVFTSLMGLFVEYLKNEGLAQGKFIIFVSIILIFFLWLGWVVADFLRSHTKKNLEICRFLKWWELDGVID